jgi:zinc/manganese transport system ATP-binding protein
VTDAGLAIDDLTLCHGERPAVHHVTARLPPAGFAAVVGPNGAGKSTLLRGILGWHRPTAGTVRFAGRAITPGRIAYLPQAPGWDTDFPVTVELAVQMGRFPRLGAWRGFAAADHAAVEAALGELGLSALRHRPLSALSGGQRQRVLLARAVAQAADIVLLDEPLSGLDQPSRADLLTRLAGWGRNGRLVIAVLHDREAVERACSHVLVLDTHLVACGAVAALGPAALDAGFGIR